MKSLQVAFGDIYTYTCPLVRFVTQAVERRHTPPDKLVQNVHILLYLGHVHGLFGVDDREGRYGSTIIQIASAWLEKAASENDLEEGVGIFEEFEGGACLNEFVGVAFEVAGLDGFKVFVELVSEDCSPLDKLGDTYAHSKTTYYRVRALPEP